MNADMANTGTHLVTFWDGKSKGTKDVVAVAKKKGLIIKDYNDNPINH